MNPLLFAFELKVPRERRERGGRERERRGRGGRKKVIASIES